MLFASCCFLWFGLSLCLASPALPWLVSSSSRGIAAASAFFYQYCGLNHYTREPENCLQQSLALSIPDEASDEITYAKNGLALGVVAYIVSIGLLFPCALMTSVALYRLSKLVKYGIPPYTSVCSPGSLFVAQILGWFSFAIFNIVFFSSLSLCSTVAGKLNDEYSYFNYGGRVEYSLMPGSVAAGVGCAFQLLGLLLQYVVARALSSVHGIGCNNGGCCRVALDDYEHGPVPEHFKVASESSTLLSRA